MAFSFSGQGIANEVEILLDKMTGFPLVSTPDLDFYIFWLPMTKIQLERYLAATTETEYDEAWYTRVLSFNPRVSPGSVSTGNYWQTLLTGILPRDAQRIAAWCGPSYKIPTSNQWWTAFERFLTIPADPGLFNRVVSLPGLTPRVRALLENIEGAVSQESRQIDGQRTAADQMLMRLGVMEYVYLNEQANSYGGYGQPHSRFFSSMDRPRKGTPQQIGNSRDGMQMKQYGFRLLRQK